MYLVPNIHPGSGSAGVPTVQANFAALLSDWTTLDTVSSMPSGGSITRSGQAMLYDSTGKLTYAPNNLLLQSQALATSPWTNYIQGTGVTPVVTNNAGTAPDGTNTATRIQLDCGAGGTSSDRSMRLQTFTTIIGVKHILSFYVKAYDAGNVGKTILLGGNTVATAVAFTLTSSWQQIFVSGTPSTTSPSIFIETRGAQTTQTADVLVWGAQVEAVTYQTTPSTYVATTTAAYYGPRFDYDPSTLAAKGLLIEGTRTNLLTYSEQFDNVAWTNGGGVTVTANTDISPDGTQTADTVVFSGASQYIRTNATSSVSGLVVTGTLYIKGTSGETIQVAVGGVDQLFTLNGSWQRLVSTKTSSVSTVGAFNINTYGGSTARTIKVWGAQLEAGAFATSYIPTVASSVARAAETFAITGYSSNLINATYIDEATGVTSVQPYNAGVAPSPSFSWLTSLRAYTNAYAGSIASPSWLSFSRTSNALMTDSTGKLTFAPNNLLLNTATLSTQSVTTLAQNYVLSFQGTGSVTCSGTNTTVLAGTGASNRVSAVLTCTAGTLTLTVSGSVTSAQLEAVTYETQPGLYVANTSSAYYGPRYDYDASTVPATPRGLLIEESRANVLTYSNTFNNAVWTTSSARISVAATAAISPDGTNNAYKLTPDSTASTTHYIIYNTFTPVSSTIYTGSIYVKRAEYYKFALEVLLGGIDGAVWFDLSTGASFANTASFTGTITSVGNGWYKLTVTAPATTSTTAGGLVLHPLPPAITTATTTSSPDGTSGLYAYGAQLEAGSFATSYIPTTSASVTRAADVADLTGAALTVAGAASGTAIIETSKWQDATTGTRYLLATGGSRRLISSSGSNNTASAYDGTTYTTATIGGSGTWTGGSVRAGVAWGTSNASIVANNGTVVTGATILGTGADVKVGRATSVVVGGFWFSSLALYNQRLPDAVLKQKSAVNAPY